MKTTTVDVKEFWVQPGVSLSHREVKPWIQANIHPAFGDPCEPTAEWQPLQHQASVLAALLLYKYMGVPLRQELCKSIRLSECLAYHQDKACTDCWCCENRVFLAPVKLRGNKWVYTFVSCDASRKQVARPVKGAEIFSVDKAFVLECGCKLRAI
tara:strand:+ start:338 stop:802 length:465 start_codon:yes stop_codon:yes gene_type:complete